MPDETYIGALCGALRAFRTAATLLGQLDRRIEEAYDAHDVEEALGWERISALYAKERRRLARSLLIAATRLEEAGSKVPNPCWRPPPWVLQEWEAICGREESGA